MEIKMEDEVYCGKQFNSWDEFFKAVEVYSARTAQPFVKTSSKLAATANKTLQVKFPETEDLKYSYYQMQCTHRGCYKSKGSGALRQNKSFKSGCLAKIYAAVNKALQKVVVTSVVTDHNHPIGHEVFQHYPKNRKLDCAEEASIIKLSKLKVSTKMLREHVEKEFGKIVRLSDIRNLKSKISLQERIGSTSLNDAQVLMQQLTEQQEADPGAIIQIGIQEDGVLRHFFFQSTAMREIFSRFPAHILIDCNYCLNDKLMSLVSFLCIDGNNESRIVGFAIIGEEAKDMIIEVLQIFKEQNAQSRVIQSLMVDKDLVEISSLQEIFPSAKVEICLFHAMKAMRAKLSTIQCSKETKDKLRDLCSTCCYAENEGIYEQARLQICSLNPVFGQYFNDNWHVMRQRWVQFWSCSRENYHSRTNSRIESYHQKLKSEVSRNAPLDLMFNSILMIIRTLEVELSYRMFQHSMRKCSGVLPHLQTTLTPFAYDHCCDVLKKSEALPLQCIIDMNFTTVVCDFAQYNVINDSFCNCNSYTSSKLPCVHVIAARLAKNIDVLPLSLFADKWLLKTNTAIVSDGALAGVNAKPITDNIVLSKANKFAMAKQVVDKIVSRLTQLGTVEFKKYLTTLKEFELELGGGGVVGGGVEEEVLGGGVEEVLGGGVERKRCKRKGGQNQKSCKSKKICIEGGENVVEDVCKQTVSDGGSTS